MRGTHLLFAHSDYNFLLRIEPTPARRMARVAYLREHATMMLENAVKRIPVASDSIIAAYRAKGIEPVWVLENNDDSKRLCWQLKDYNPTANETHAAELLRACICAQELGDVPEFKLMHAGRTQIENNRIKGRSGKLSDATKKRIARAYWGMVANGQTYGAVKELAALNDVSETTIHTIAKKYKPDSIDK